MATGGRKYHGFDDDDRLSAKGWTTRQFHHFEDHQLEALYRLMMSLRRDVSQRAPLPISTGDPLLEEVVEQMSTLTQWDLYDAQKRLEEDITLRREIVAAGSLDPLAEAM